MDLLAQLNGLPGELEERLRKVAGDADLEAARVDFLGRKGRLAELMSHLRDLSPAERPAFGQAANAVKQRMTELLDERKALQEQERRKRQKFEKLCHRVRPSLDFSCADASSPAPCRVSVGSMVNGRPMSFSTHFANPPVATRRKSVRKLAASSPTISRTMPR